MTTAIKTSCLVVVICFAAAGQAPDAKPAAQAEDGMPISPLQVLGMPLEDLLKEYTGGDKQYGLDAAGYSVVGARYKQNWFGGDQPIDADYVIAPMPPNPVTQITLRPPKGVNRTQLIASIAKYLGTPEQGPTQIGAPAQYFAQWIRDGVLFDLEDYGEYLDVYIQPALFQEAKAFGFTGDWLVLSRADADITGDKMVDRVLLVGMREDEHALFFDKLTMILKMPKALQGSAFPLAGSLQGGYGPHVIAQNDFDGDAVPDVLVSADSGGSGGIVNYGIFSVREGTCRQLFDSERDALPKFSGQLIDGYKALLKIEDTNEVTNLDLSDRKADYDQLGIYGDGKLLKPTELWGDTFVQVTPVDDDKDGVFELQGIQAISGAYHADRVAMITSVLKWRDGKWTLVKSQVEPVKAGQ